MTFLYGDIGPYNVTRMNGIGVTFVRSTDGGNILAPPVNLSQQIDRGSFGAQWDNPAVSDNHIYMIMTNNTRNDSIEMKVLNQMPLEKNDSACGWLYGFKGGLP